MRYHSTSGNVGLIETWLDLSAILSIIFCAFVMMNRVGDKVSQDTHTVIRYVLKMCAIICEIIIFILLGITSVQEFMSDFLHHWAKSKLLSLVYIIYLPHMIRLISYEHMQKCHYGAL